MVARSTAKQHWQHGGRDEYWKIYNHNIRTRAEMIDILNKRIYQVSTSLEKPELVRLMERSDRGLLRYENYLTAELRAFCAQRQLQVAGPDTARRIQLLNALEEADEAQEFRYLVELPAELRLLVYTLYFKSLSELDEPVQPPILKTNSLIRQEALPLFYRNCTFLVTRFVDSSYQCTGIDKLLTRAKFWDRISEDYVGIMNNLELNYFERTEYFDGTILLRWSDGDIKIYTREGERIPNPGASSRRLAWYLWAIRIRSAGGGLRKADVVELRKLILLH